MNSIQENIQAAISEMETVPSAQRDAYERNALEQLRAAAGTLQMRAEHLAAQALLAAPNPAPEN